MHNTAWNANAAFFQARMRSNALSHLACSRSFGFREGETDAIDALIGDGSEVRIEAERRRDRRVKLFALGGFSRLLVKSYHIR